MIVKFIKGLAKLTLFAAGTVAVIGVWDYSQRAKAADDGYSVATYRASVLDRYGDDAGKVLAAAKGGLANGYGWLAQSGAFDLVGLAERLGPADDEALGDALPAAASAAGEPPLQLASAQEGLAPQTSLFPRARALQ